MDPALTEKADVIPLEGLQLALALFLLPVHHAALPALFRDRYLALRPSGDATRLAGIDHRHLRERALDLFPLERLVIDEREGVETDAQALRDARDRLALRAPADLRMEEVLVQSPLPEDGHHVVGIVLAGDRMQDAATVRLLDRGDDVEPETNALRSILDQGPIPERVVQVPHDALPRLGRRGQPPLALEDGRSA